jgi:hypothetical protein
MKKNEPEYINPMQAMMRDGMPGLPNIIQNAMPVLLPQMDYNQNPISMIFGNYKRSKLSKAKAIEAEIAENSNKALTFKLNSIHDVITFSARVTNTLGEFEHRKTMRSLEIQEKNADIYMKNAQAQQMGFEAKLSELDYNIKLKQYQKMSDGEDVGGGTMI